MTIRIVMIFVFAFMLASKMGSASETTETKPILKIAETNYWYGKIIYSFKVNGAYTIISTKGAKNGKNYSRAGSLDPSKLTKLINSLKAIKYFETTHEAIEKERKKLNINSRMHINDATNYSITFHKNELKHTMNVGAALPKKIKAHPKVLGYPIQAKVSSLLIQLKLLLLNHQTLKIN